ncbi:MAG: phytoene/squalene synthase family protein [Saprospiraceae bacterium]|nr:phytoene/squalene synthase family protein [Saprospiraceae bacterium]
MSDLNTYQQYSQAASKMLTRRYSTSFSLGIRLFAPEFREPITSIYGFVRIADEIVDSFSHPQAERLLEKFREDTFQSIDMGISTNPVLQAFQAVVHKYGLERSWIAAFFDSMAMDLGKARYNREEFDRYVYGSAEVVGLMCLAVFLRGDKGGFAYLEHPAKKLGAAFQKINFLRDMKSDYEERGRVYFPGVHIDHFSDRQKLEIEQEVAKDLHESVEGIRNLPIRVRTGVFLAYAYFSALLQNIRRARASEILLRRFRIPNGTKYAMLFKYWFLFRIRLI